MTVSFLKHYYNFSITFNVILRSISGTGKVHSVGLSSWDIQKLSSLDLNESTESTSTAALGKLFQILTRYSAIAERPRCRVR